MNLKEYEDNRFTKEKTKVEKYLLRIIQRYFDIANNYTKESIEAMIVESLTRFKRDLIDDKGFIFSLNQKTGNIVLTIQELGGEPKIDKNTAFNKDFGTTADTICRGNDVRLTNKRQPLEHNHNAFDIIGLKELLESIDGDFIEHVHHNKNILDILYYTGNSAKLDLKIIDQLQDKTNKYLDQLKHQENIVSSFSDLNIEDLDNCLYNINNKFENTKKYILESITWVKKATNDIDQSFENFYDNQKIILNDYFKKDKIDMVQEELNKIYSVIYEKEFDISNENITYKAEHTNTNNINYQDSEMLSYFGDRTLININKTFIQNVPQEIMSEHDDIKLKTFLKYTKDDVEYKCQLPFYLKDKNGTEIIIQDCYTKNGELKVAINILDDIPLYITDDLIHGNKVIFPINTKIVPSKIMNYFTGVAHVAKINSLEKENTIKQIIRHDNSKYLFQCLCTTLDETICVFVDYDENILSYTNLNNTPSVSDLGVSGTKFMYYNYNNKMNILRDTNEAIYSILEYSFPKIKNYFNNPRICFQVLGSKEENNEIIS